MRQNQLISVIIPVFNCERFVGEALESVLAQTLPPDQIIVVDDGSRDGTAGVVRSFGPRIEYVFKENGGISSAVNLGLSHARCDVFAFLDADDVWTTEKLHLQMNEMNRRPELDMVFGHVEQFHEGIAVKEMPEDISASSIAGYCRGAVAIKRTSFFRVGSFDSQWVVGEFIEWYARAIDIGLTGTLLPDVVLRRRIHGDNTMIRRQKATTDYIRILKASLDRRRNNAPLQTGRDVDGTALAE